jgi:hypothetical protein
MKRVIKQSAPARKLLGLLSEFQGSYRVTMEAIGVDFFDWFVTKQP